MKLTDEDQEWLRSRGPTGHEADVAAAIARGYERGKADAVAAYPKEYFARCDERNAAEDAQAKAEADRDRLAKRCEDLEWQAQKAPIRERSDRLAALEQRVGALVEALLGCFGPDGAESYGEMAARLAALRSPGVGVEAESDRCRQAAQRLIEIVGADGPMDLEDVVEWVGGRVEASESALATARRERDEAVSVVRRCAVGLGDPCKRDCSHDACWVISEARALVAGQGEADDGQSSREARVMTEAYGLVKTALAARDAEIAALRTSLAEAQGEGRAERSKRVAAEHAAADTVDAMLRVERDCDTLRARVAELEAREKGARWLLATAHITKSLTPPEWHSKREAWLAGGHAAPIPDPARGLIERAAKWFEAHRTGDFTPEYAAHIELDLRAYLGGGT